MHQLTGDFYTVGEVLGHTLAGIGVSLGLSMNFEAVTARYVDVRLERKKEVLDAYHGAVKQADPAKAEKAEPKIAKNAAERKILLFFIIYQIHTITRELNTPITANTGIMGIHTFT